MKEGREGEATDALGRESARTFDARYHQRGLPTRVEAAHGVRAIVERLWAGYGGCQPRSVRICTDLCVRRGPRRSAASRATVLEVLARAACWQTVTLCRRICRRGPRRTRQGSGSPSKDLRPAQLARFARSACVTVPRKAGLGTISCRSAGTLRPVGDIGEVARANASSVFSPVQI